MSEDEETPAAIATLLKRCEEALLDPAVRRDRSRLDALMDENFQEFGSSGRAWTREQVLDLLATENYTPPAIEDFRCVMIADGVALITYRTVRFEAQTGLETASLRSSIWTRQAKGWRLRFHQGTRISKRHEPV